MCAFLAKESLVHNVIWHVTTGREHQSFPLFPKPNQSQLHGERGKNKQTKTTKPTQKNTHYLHHHYVMM